MKRLALTLALAAISLSGGAASAQMVPIVGENIHDGAAIVALGSISFTPTLCNGQPTAFTLGGTQQFSASPFPFSIVDGSIVNALLPDTSQTVPHICFAARAINLVTGGVILKTGYSTMQPAPGASWCSTASGVTTCNFNAYQPVTTGQASTASAPAIGPMGPQGIQGVAGPAGPAGAAGPAGPAGSGGAIPVAFTGDVTGTGVQTIVATLPPLGTAQTVGDATHIAQVTTNGKGLVVNVAAVPIAASLMTWTAAGTCSAQLAGCAESGQWTPSAAIVVTKVQVYAGTAPAGCSTPGALSLQAGSAPVLAVPLANGTQSYTAAGPVNVAAGTVLSLQTSTTAAAGCSTYANNFGATVEYRMQ